MAEVIVEELTSRTGERRVEPEISILHTIFGPRERLQECMNETPTAGWIVMQQDSRISEAVKRERPRLRNFIRKRVADAADAEDILQDVFYELVEAYRLMKPIEHLSGWLYQVARNRIRDLFRRKKPAASMNDPVNSSAEDGDFLQLEDLLPSPDAGPDAAFARSVLLEELDHAIEELPADQREVFIAHEIEGQSFKEIAAATGVSVNTLLSRKHYAVLHLRDRLQTIYDEFEKS